jgi:hypothetical protein
MTRCSKCGKKIGWLSNKYECSHSYCDKVFCENCAESARIKCPECQFGYCNEHIKNHNCEPDNVYASEGGAEEPETTSFGYKSIEEADGEDADDINIIVRKNTVQISQRAKEEVQEWDNLSDVALKLIKPLSTGDSIKVLILIQIAINSKMVLEITDIEKIVAELNRTGE